MTSQSWAKSWILGVAVAVVSNAAIAAPIIRGNYYEQNANATCNAGTSCTVIFTAAADKSRIIVDNVSCSIVAGATNVRRGFLGRRVGENVLQAQFLIPEFVAKTGSQNQYLINTAATLEFQAGERPAIRVVTAGSTRQAIACQIVGRVFTSV